MANSHDRAEAEGRQAAKDGRGIDSNPYAYGSYVWVSWRHGYLTAGVTFPAPGSSPEPAQPEGGRGAGEFRVITTFDLSHGRERMRTRSARLKQP